MEYIIVMLFITIALIAKVNKSKNNKNINCKEKDEELNLLIEELRFFFSNLNASPSEYISYIEKQGLINKLKILDSQCSKYKFNKNSTIYMDYKKLKNISANIDQLIEERNRRFINIESERCKTLFDDIDGKSLDKQQRTAIVTNELHNLVIAGAGSGKTLTISGKVKYLCTEKGISPNEILLISFTTKAAEEMTSRIKDKLRLPVNSVTFHKLGLDIIKSVEKSRPDVYEDTKNIISKELLAMCSTDIMMTKLLNFFAYYLAIPADLVKYDKLGEYIDAEKSYDLESLKSKYYSLVDRKISLYGERMKSLEEVMIANFLFLHGIEYEYEKEYPYESEDKYRKKYRPDFYLKEYDIYLEHFGVNEKMECPWLSKVDSDKYRKDIEWKRRTHINNGTTLLETYSYYQSKGILLQQLETILKKNNVTFKEMDKNQLIQCVNLQKEDRKFKDFTNLICNFISLYKAKGYTAEQFTVFRNRLAKEKNLFIKERSLLFFDIAEEIFNKYQNHLLSNHYIDFADMINKATKYVKDRKIKLHYKYIIIDEYQDISFDRYRLIKEILNFTGARLMCVGDDWQSIYRFSGSDVSLFTKFESFWGASKILKIENTYRNSQELIDVSGGFIMTNKAQIPKAVKSNKQCLNPVNILMYNTEEYLAIKKALDLIAEENKLDTTVFLLGRTNYEIDILKKNKKVKEDFKFIGDVDILYLKHPNLKITFLTVHKSKGMEADNVIVLNLKNVLLGFPNKIIDDPLLSYVLDNDDTYPFEEERRLFYVALTRTRNKAYLMVPENNPSIFIKEIDKVCNVIPLNKDNSIAFNPECPKCKTGKLISRKDKSDRKFIGCSNYPQCDYTSNDVSILHRDGRLETSKRLGNNNDNNDKNYKEQGAETSFKNFNYGRWDDKKTNITVSTIQARNEKEKICVTSFNDLDNDLSPLKNTNKNSKVNENRGLVNKDHSGKKNIFRPNTLVIHSEFGEGKIISNDLKIIKVEFEKQRILNFSFEACIKEGIIRKSNNSIDSLPIDKLIQLSDKKFAKNEFDNNAIIINSRIITHNKNTLKYYFRLADCYKQQNLFDEAIATYKQILKIDKNNIEAKDNITYLEELYKTVYKEFMKNGNFFSGF